MCWKNLLNVTPNYCNYGIFAYIEHYNYVLMDYVDY